METKLTDEAKERVFHIVDYAYEQPELVGTSRNALELHVFAANWNWGNASFEPLWRVITDPQCDKGTALLIYWYGAPDYFYEKHTNNEQLHESELERFNFLKEIETRYISGFYTHQDISFDPSTLYGEFFSRASRHVPAEMQEKTSGVDVSESL